MPRPPKVKRGRKPRGFPSSVQVFGHKVRIVYCHVMPKTLTDSFGVTYFDTKRIYISLEQPRDEMERTLFHEFCHMVLFLSGHSFNMKEDDEEAVVRALEHGLYPLYKRRRL